MAAREQTGFSIKGNLYEVFETKVLSEKFKKREIVIEYASNPQYPQYIKLDLQNDNCSLIDAFNIHDEVEVFFDLKGKPYTNRNGEKTYFTNLVVWRIVELNSKKSETPAAEEVPEPGSNDFGSDDLPF
jgi:hypothetical protein